VHNTWHKLNFTVAANAVECIHVICSIKIDTLMLNINTPAHILTIDKQLGNNLFLHHGESLTRYLSLLLQDPNEYKPRLSTCPREEPSRDGQLYDGAAQGRPLGAPLFAHRSLFV
jgi:hypothetical protein